MLQAFLKELQDKDCEAEVVKLALEVWVVPNHDQSIPVSLKLVVENMGESALLRGLEMFIVGRLRDRPVLTSSTLLSSDLYSVFGTTRKTRLSQDSTFLELYDGIPNVKVDLGAKVRRTVHEIEADAPLNEIDIEFSSPLAPGEKIALRIQWDQFDLVEESEFSRHAILRLFNPIETGYPRKVLERLDWSNREIRVRQIYEPRQLLGGYTGGGYSGGFDIAMYVPEDYHPEHIAPSYNSVSKNRNVDAAARPSAVRQSKYTWRVRQLPNGPPIDFKYGFGSPIVIDARFTSSERSRAYARQLDRLKTREGLFLFLCGLLGGAILAIIVNWVTNPQAAITDWSKALMVALLMVLIILVWMAMRAHQDYNRLNEDIRDSSRNRWPPED